MRIRKTSPNSDHLRNAPPNDLLPPELVKLLDEYRRLSRDHETAHNEWRNLRVHRREDDQLARREDGAAASQAAREGMNIDGTPAQDGLVKRRTKAEQRANALTDALDAVRRDILNTATAYRDSDAATRRLANGQTKLAKAGDAFLAAMSAAVAERAVADWLNGLPYDDSALFDLVALTGNSSSIGPRIREVPPIDGFTAVRHITTLAN